MTTPAPDDSSDQGPGPVGAATGRVVMPGGVANAGEVAREGDEVLRPERPTTETAHRVLRHARAHGFLGVPEPRGIAGGVERLAFVPGEVPLPPFPGWWKRDDVLASTAGLLRAFHDATQDFMSDKDALWSTELADPGTAEVICHNDVCPENVVYRNGEAAALLDFDFMAPGRRVYDLAQLAKMCCPLDAPEGARRLGFGKVDPVARLRVVADGYGLPPDREAFIDAIDDAVAVGDDFVERHVSAGEPAFVAMWNASGGRNRLERRKSWLAQNRQRMLDALG